MSRLYPCVYCTEDGYCEKYSDKEVTSWCVQSPCKDEKPSNADHIRSMTNEELSKWYFDVFFKRTPYCSIHEDCPEHDDCELCLLDWLREECKSED